MLQLGSFSAWVSVDGTECPEYAIERSESSDGTQETCWIASEAGKNFAVSWKVLDVHPNRITSYEGVLSLDGTRCASRILRPSSPVKQLTMKGVDTSQTTQRLLLFSKIELTDDDTYLHSATPELGDIKLELWEVLLLHDEIFAQNYKTPEPQQKVHERSKKGSTHCINFAEETPQPPVKTTRTFPVRRLCTFIFKYRPLEILQANRIAPMDKTVTQQAEVSGDTFDLTHEEDKDVAGQIKELEAQLERLKRTQESNQRVKTEVKTEPRNIWQPREIIDLT